MYAVLIGFSWCVACCYDGELVCVLAKLEPWPGVKRVEMRARPYNVCPPS